MKKKIIISGGPSSGKTSIINELIKQGYHCKEEFSRHIIDEGIRTGSGIVPWDKLDLFTEKVFDGRVKQFHEVDELNDTIFYDRSIIDSITYMVYDKEIIPEKYITTAKEMRYYPKVFITPYWDDIYVNDEHRKEPSEKAKQLEKYTIDCYKDYGYEVVLIPKASITERVNFILNSINE